MKPKIVKKQACGRNYVLPGGTLIHQCRGHVDGACWCPCGIVQRRPGITRYRYIATGAPQEQHDATI